MDILDILKKYLKINNLTLEDIVTRTQISRSKIHNYLSGRTRLEFNAFIDICNALGVSSAQVVAEYTNEDIIQTEEYVKHSIELEEVEEKLFYSEKTINELESKNIKEIFHSRAKSYLESVYLIKFETDDIKSIVKEHPYKNDKIGIQYYNKGIEIYEQIIKYNIDPHTISDIVSILKFKNEEEHSLNRTYRNFINELLNKFDNEQYEIETLIRVNLAKKDGNKFTKNLINENQEEINEYKHRVNTLYRNQD